jgi:hypothetical protein
MFPYIAVIFLLKKLTTMKQEFTDFLVECGNPAAFDQTINSMGAVLFDGGQKGQYQKDENGYYTMRVYGDPGYIKFAIQNQGYGKIIKELAVSS